MTVTAQDRKAGTPMHLNLRAIAAIYRFEMARTWRTPLQSIVSPVLSTALYFIVFGGAIGSRMQSVEASRGVEEVKSDVEEDRGDTHQPDRHGMRLGAPATRAPPGRQQSTVRLRSYRPRSCDSKVAGSIGSGCSSTRPVDAAIAVS